MSNVTIFESGNVPAYIKAAATAGNLAEVSIGQGFPVVSIKGKVFTLKEGDQSRLITKPGTDEPASALEVVILDVGPSADLKYNSRVFYAKSFEEGVNAKPDCSSNDGIQPTADSPNKQAEKCALCQHNVKGSGSTGKGKACRSSKRLAIATADNLDYPMMLRVPGDSLLAFSDYMKQLKQKGVGDTAQVITKIGFDYSVAHPALTFKGLGWVDAGTFAALPEAQANETVGFITGKTAMPRAEEEEFAPMPAYIKQETPKIESKPEPKKAAKKTDDDDDLPTEPKVATKVEVEDAPAKVEAAAPVKVADADLDEALDDLDFDA